MGTAGLALSMCPPVVAVACYVKRAGRPLSAMIASREVCSGASHPRTVPLGSSPKVPESQKISSVAFFWSRGALETSRRLTYLIFHSRPSIFSTSWRWYFIRMSSKDCITSLFTLSDEMISISRAHAASQSRPSLILVSGVLIAFLSSAFSRWKSYTHKYILRWRNFSLARHSAARLT